MVWGVLEDKHMEHVPGTVLLADRSDLPEEYKAIPRDLLKHGTGRNADTILAPQPSASPNDPLNWPTWKKDLILAITGLSAGVVGAYGPMLSPGFVVVSAELGIDINTLAQATAWLILTIGLSLFLFNPVAKKFGRRPVYLACSVILLSASIWGALAKNFSSFLGSRIWGGLGMAPYEVLVQCTIADMYFVHQRATRIAVWNMFLLCGISGGALIAGYIIENQGWQWTFAWCAILFGILLPLVFLFVPETAYNRSPLPHEFAGADLHRTITDDVVTAGAKDTPVAAPVASNASEATAPLPVAEKPIADFKHDEARGPYYGDGPVEPKHTYAQSLRVYTGVYSRTPLWKIFTRPFVIFFYPAVFWAFLMYGATLTWIVVFSVVNANIFTKDPYNFTVSQTGLISLSPFVFTLIGEVIAGPLSDWMSLWMARRNKGVYEPEFRLPLVVFPLIVGIVGFFGFGATVHYKTHWSGPVLCFGLANMALALMNPVVFGYVIDAHIDLTEEAFVAINARNFLTFGLTYFVNDWLEASGPLNVFNVLGSIYIAVILTTIPLWFYGKRARGYIARNKTLHKFMHED